MREWRALRHFEAVGNKLQMGEMDVNRAVVMRSTKRSFRPVMAVDHDSAVYTSVTRRACFMHRHSRWHTCLYFGESLQLAFMKNKDPKEAFLSTYGLPLEAVQRDLEA